MQHRMLTEVVVSEPTPPPTLLDDQFLPLIAELESDLHLLAPITIRSCPSSTSTSTRSHPYGVKRVAQSPSYCKGLYSNCRHYHARKFGSRMALDFSIVIRVFMLMVWGFVMVFMLLYVLAIQPAQSSNLEEGELTS